MIAYWPFWLGGSALAAILVGHWFFIHRSMAISGRFTAIVNRWRHGPAPTEPMSDAELISAMEAATLAAFGEGALRQLAAESKPDSRPVKPAPTASQEPQTFAAHLVFLCFLAVGGFLSAVLDGRFAPRLALRSDLLPRIFGHELSPQLLVLFGGGLLVGFGTRMAGGCTSGHGLCGTSRFQVGSLVATAAFFGAGVAASLGLGRFIR